MDSMSGVKSGGYTVTKVADQCAKDCCGPMCTKAECNQLCIHMYTCDKACYDFNNGHICKHIHRVHSITQTRISTTTTEHTNNQTSSEELSLEESYDLDPFTAKNRVKYGKTGFPSTSANGKIDGRGRVLRLTVP